MEENEAVGVFKDTSDPQTSDRTHVSFEWRITKEDILYLTHRPICSPKFWLYNDQWKVEIHRSLSADFICYLSKTRTDDKCLISVRILVKDDKKVIREKSDYIFCSEERFSSRMFSLCEFHLEFKKPQKPTDNSSNELIIECVIGYGIILKKETCFCKNWSKDSSSVEGFDFGSHTVTSASKSFTLGIKNATPSTSSNCIFGSTASTTATSGTAFGISNPGFIFGSPKTTATTECSFSQPTASTTSNIGVLLGTDTRRAICTYDAPASIQQPSALGVNTSSIQTGFGFGSPAFGSFAPTTTTTNIVSSSLFFGTSLETSNTTTAGFNFSSSSTPLDGSPFRFSNPSPLGSTNKNLSNLSTSLTIASNELSSKLLNTTIAFAKTSFSTNTTPSKMGATITNSSVDLIFPTAFSLGTGVTSTETTRFETPAGIKALVQNFEQLFVSERQSDIEIKVGNQTFKAHKSILAAQSTVFDAMFEHPGMTENVEGIIEVKDCAEETFKDFLLFLYTGDCHNLVPSTAITLYKTSDKYNVEQLKQLCRSCLINDLVVDVVVDAVLIADLYDEKEIMDKATQVFLNETEEILSSEKWDNFVLEHYYLAKGLLLKMAKFNKEKTGTTK